MEIYKDIKGYEGMYQVSNLGNVKSLKRKGCLKDRMLKGTINNLGYSVYNFSGKQKKTHQLVAIAFLNHTPNGYNGLVVDHIDSNRLNNELSNLQLISQRLNTSKDKKNCSSKYTGVCWCKRSSKWLSSIRIKGKSKSLGYFTNELDASNKYQEALKKTLK
tara:strand:+ start:32 stop:514 length:483 start_codon:yes stop_codon:yes gene_type:complete